MLLHENKIELLAAENHRVTVLNINCQNHPHMIQNSIFSWGDAHACPTFKRQ